MDIQEFKEAQARLILDIDEIIKKRKGLHELRKKAIRRFSYDFIKNKMTIDDYVIGKEKNHKNRNFCYVMERQLDGLGRIIGANAFKFGVYYGVTKNDDDPKYRARERWGNSPSIAFSNIKSEILNLLDAGLKEDYDALVSNQLSHMFKGKILSVYYPNKYLNVFSEDHLNYYLEKLGLMNKVLAKANPIYKRLALQQFKDKDKFMKDWSLDIFSYFLYSEYPKRPSKKTKYQLPKELESYSEPQFPSSQVCSFIECEIDQYQNDINSNKQGKGGKGNYEKDNRYKSKLGEQGEKLVIDLEIEFLKKNNLSHLIPQIDHVALRDDSAGYDILSFDKNSNPKYIEVKATKNTNEPLHFYLTANEMETSLELDNYYLYIVTGVMTATPQIKIVKNPFKLNQEKLKITPVKYHIGLRTKENI